MTQQKRGHPKHDRAQLLGRWDPVQTNPRTELPRHPQQPPLRSATARPGTQPRPRRQSALLRRFDRAERDTYGGHAPLIGSCPLPPGQTPACEAPGKHPAAPPTYGNSPEQVGSGRRRRVAHVSERARQCFFYLRVLASVDSTGDGTVGRSA